MQVRGFSSATHNRAREIMYHHVKKLMYTVRVDTPDPKLAPIVHLLQTSLGEEENVDQLLNQRARPLMSVAKMPENVE
jgi:Manganese containing catalase